MSMEWLWAMPRSAKEAREKGEKHYFTGCECRNGHLTFRLSANHRCAECNRQNVRKAWRRHAERRKPQRRTRNSRNIAELSRSYVANCMDIHVSNLSDELYELKKAQLIVNRAIKETYL